MKCKNIDFSHTKWSPLIFSNTEYVCHIVDNIININMGEYRYEHSQCCTLLHNIIMCAFALKSHEHAIQSTNYLLNNGNVSNNTFIFLNHYSYPQYGPILYKYKHFVKYLTKISLGRFIGFYNIEKYYDTCVILLLIIKVYQRSPNNGHNQWLPPNVIKHLVLPFVYQ